MIPIRSRVSGLPVLIGGAVALLLSMGGPTADVSAADPEVPKIRQLRCGTCPEGFATTAITTDPATCKDGDPTLVQCAPLGGNLLTVCGECPDEYDKIGSSTMPSQCARDGGAMSRCQRRTMEFANPDATQGGRRCPPDCAGEMPTGQGGSGPVPQTIPAPKLPTKP